MSQEKQFCRNCGKRDDLMRGAFWEPGLCIDCHRLPVIGIRYDVFTGGRIEPLRITWDVNVPPNTSVSIDTCNHDVETRIEPVTKHDGKLDAAGDEQYGAKIEFFDIHPPTALLLLSGGYGASENAEVYLDPKQALSLLAWLEQEKGKLEELAKEQAE